MSTIQRPTKQGGATTYQGKVTAGYTAILASEMDADLDTIYSAWNTGVDTVNIRDGSITGAKLAAGAVGTRELADSGVATVDIADGAVTTPKIADGAVTPGKMAGGGVMGGDLTGVYPNPALSIVQSGLIQLLSRGAVYVAGSVMDIQANLTGNVGYDNTKPSWFARFDYGNDAYEVWRAPPPGTAFVRVFQVLGTGRTVATLADGSIGRAQLAVNAIYGGSVTALPPASFSLSANAVWTTWVTLPAMTTRGGNVALMAYGNLSVTGAGGSAVCSQRWLRDGALVGQQRAQLIATPGGTYVPLNQINIIDTSAPAGAHTYSYQLFVNSPVVVQAFSSTEGLLQAVEIG